LKNLTRTSRNQKKKIKSARKVAEPVLVEGTQRIRKGFLCDALCAFASGLREILAFLDLNFHFLAEFEITNIKSQITSNFQNPIFKFSNKITESYGFIGHWDLVFEFYL